jgi:hypothetical protein
LLLGADKLGPLYVRGNNLKEWKKKIAVVNGNYLYVFDKPKDAIPE